MWEKDQRAPAADAAKGVAAGAGGSDAAEGDRSGQECDPADRVCKRFVTDIELKAFAQILRVTTDELLRGGDE